MNINENLQGLYSPSFEHDNCGIGAVVDIRGRKSHQIVSDALQIVERLEHRAGKDAAGQTGDGVGIMTQIPHAFFRKVCPKAGILIGGEREYGVGMFFFPMEETKRAQAKKVFEAIVQKEGLRFLGWRDVAIRSGIPGQKARECMPFICQGFIEKPREIEKGLPFDRKLYVIRRIFEQSCNNTSVPSLSSRTVVYKGMLLVKQLRAFFADLEDDDFESAIAMVHSRFSTNTNPSWERAHPNRFTVHNGEINTIKGNADKMLAREETMRAVQLSQEDLKRALPVISPGGSDSAMLDNTLEFLTMNGMELPLAAMITIPEPFSHNETLSPKARDFYQYYATMMEPWDGPASILFSDGDVMGAMLDRNGLRPSRYYITDDERLILSSEVGVVDIMPEHVVKKERLHPGKMLLIDTVRGAVQYDDEIKEYYAGRSPYGEWLYSNLTTLSDLKIPNGKTPCYTGEELTRLQKAFGYSFEDYREGICQMALNGAEQIGSMGADTPLAALSNEYQPLFHYFRQLFAQVTNPPIDALREKIVTSATVYAGRAGSLLLEKPENCRVLRINNPILSDLDLMKIKKTDRPGLSAACIPIIYDKGASMERALEHLFEEVDKAYRNGADILILSDRGVDENHVAIPSLLAVSAVHKYLVRMKKGTALSIILESGEPHSVHHFAALLGYGACAVNPYLAHASIKRLIEDGLINKDYYAAMEDYDQAVICGIVKTASKMGISTIQSYQGSQIFEAVGIHKDVIDRYFTGTVSRVGGISLEDIGMRAVEQHAKAFDPLGLACDMTLPSRGGHKMRSQGEEHRYNPQTIHLLQRAAREGSYEIFEEYTKLADTEFTGNLRSLMDFNYPEKALPLSEVESEESIVMRFKTGAMSYGSISQEAHEALAVAMNRLKGKSNSGEGGESLERLASAGAGNDRSSAIRQVASGRFGVTSRYLAGAKEIQIKMAQGAKPGEGGHLPAAKVYPWIAKTRNSTPGVSLISPPPHHDIYSIEDLAQLIYDLKNANKYARISVKLVSETGVGTVAAGVAKAGAQVILISGCDGGTGAAPVGSIHNAGLPWELGLAETHQTLIKNGLRSQVILETDGKLMSGRDVAVAALLGAEEFGFATAPLVTLGCVMMRVCNLDTCPVGIATQNPKLRGRFAGKPEYVMNFMYFIARQLREYMARLGVRTIEEMVGRTDLLKKKEGLSGQAARMDLSLILKHTEEHAGKRAVFNPDDAYDFQLEKTKDEAVLLKNGSILSAIENGMKTQQSIQITNTDRAFGTLLGAELTRRHPEGLPDDTVTIRCAGAGGQSFGAFLPKGLTISLCGDGNDYFGKGLSGGKLAVSAPSGVKFDPSENIIIGNVALYGATSGEAYIAGMAGERFCVRNSGAYAVVEGVGEHGCEYMTGGRAVILGPVGKNFAAGMSGGVAYVLDEDNSLYQRLNRELALMEKVVERADQEELNRMIKAHVAYTGSVKGQRILDDYEKYLPLFKKIVPADYKRLLELTLKYEGQGMSRERAQTEAFYESVGRI